MPGARSNEIAYAPLCGPSTWSFTSLLKLGGNAGTQGWGMIAVASQKARTLDCSKNFQGG